MPAAAALALPLAAGVFTAPPVFAKDGTTLIGREADLKASTRIPTIAGKDNVPSPGLADALRRYSESLLRGAPDDSLMTPHLQGATRESLQLLLNDTNHAGAVARATSLSLW